MGPPERVNPDDVRVRVDPRDRLALTLEALGEARVGALGDRLDRVARVRRDALREKDDAHGPLAEGVEEPVVPDPEAGPPGEDLVRARGRRVAPALVDHRESLARRPPAHRASSVQS